MKANLLFSALLLLIAILPARAQVKFDDYFLQKTMRFDYYHAGDARSEYFFFDEVIEEPYWAGNKHYLVDDREMGNHLFKLIDKASGKVIYQRGYSTLFAEWACPKALPFPIPKTMLSSNSIPAKTTPVSL